MIIFFLAGLVCILLGSLIIYQKYYYGRHASETMGTVVAIRERISRSQGASRSSGVTYIPIVEYNFEGENYWFSAGGSSFLEHRIGEGVKLLSMPYGPEFVMLKKDHSYTVGLIIIGLGVMASLVFAFFSDWHFQHKLIGMGASVLVILFFILFLKNKMKKAGVDIKNWAKMSKPAHLVTKDSLQGEKVFWSQSEIKKLRKKINSIGLVISSIFLSLSCFLFLFLWGKLPGAIKQIFEDSLHDLSALKALKPFLFKPEPLLIGVLLTGVFSLMGIHSLIYSLRKNSLTP